MITVVETSRLERLERDAAVLHAVADRLQRSMHGTWWLSPWRADTADPRRALALLVGEPETSR